MRSQRLVWFPCFWLQRWTLIVELCRGWRRTRRFLCSRGPVLEPGLEPFAKRRAVDLGWFPFAAGLMVNVHRHPICFLPGGHGTRDQVSLLMKEFYSSSMAARHLSTSGHFMASFYWSGSKQWWLFCWSSVSIAAIAFHCFFWMRPRSERRRGWLQSTFELVESRVGAFFRGPVYWVPETPCLWWVSVPHEYASRTLI